MDGNTVDGSPDASLDFSLLGSFMSQRHPDESVSSLGLTGSSPGILAASAEKFADNSKPHRCQSNPYGEVFATDAVASACTKGVGGSDGMREGRSG